VTYRNESDGLRARVAQLEEELAEARGTIARLTGAAADVTARQGSDRGILGAPLHQEIRRELPFEVTDAGYEAIAAMLQTHLGSPADARFGRIGQVGGTLRYQSGVVEIALSRGVGMSSLRLSANHKHRSLALGVCSAIGAFFGIVPAGMAARALGMDKANLIWMLPTLLVLSWAALRPIFRKSALSNQRDLHGVFESIAELASQHQVKKRARVAWSAPPGARVEGAADAEADADADADAVNEASPDTRRSRAG
jgi:hypothetical protein